MRRAMSPAICTDVTVCPLGVSMTSALRSFSSEALSMAALKYAPGKYSTFVTAPSTGERCEWTLKTFMNTLILSASRPA